MTTELNKNSHDTESGNWITDMIEQYKQRLKRCNAIITKLNNDIAIKKTMLKQYNSDLNKYKTQQRKLYDSLTNNALDNNKITNEINMKEMAINTIRQNILRNHKMYVELNLSSTQYQICKLKEKITLGRKIVTDAKELKNYLKQCIKF